MLKPRVGQKRGLVVCVSLQEADLMIDLFCHSYVDNQLRNSRRFDAEGIERDHPELFEPFPRRRTSSNNSLASMSSASVSREDFNVKDEGQLRYWTSVMCSQSPHLFDFVITVRAIYQSTYHNSIMLRSLEVTGPFFSLHGFSRRSSLQSSRLRSAHSVFSPTSTSPTIRLSWILP